MNDILRITLAEPVVQGVIKLGWNDGYEGVVDLRGIIANGDIFRRIRNPDNFKMVRIEKCGHYIYWGNKDDEEVDFGCDRLRELEQAALLAHAS